MFRLAGHLKMTVRELSERMDSRELSEWLAYHRYFEPLPDAWKQTGLLASASLAPYCPRGRTPKVSDFVPVETPPQHDLQIKEAFERLNADLDAG